MSKIGYLPPLYLNNNVPEPTAIGKVRCRPEKIGEARKRPRPTPSTEPDVTVARHLALGIDHTGIIPTGVSLMMKSLRCRWRYDMQPASCQRLSHLKMDLSLAPCPQEICAA